MNVLKKLCDYISEQADTEKKLQSFIMSLDDDEKGQLRSFKTIFEMIRNHDTIYNLKFQTNTTNTTTKQIVTIRLTYKEPNTKGVITNAIPR